MIFFVNYLTEFIYLVDSTLKQVVFLVNIGSKQIEYFLEFFQTYRFLCNKNISPLIFQF